MSLFESLSVEQIKALLPSPPPCDYSHLQLDHPDGLMEAAVLVLLVQLNAEWHLVFTRRTDSVRDHKGQVAFPGGSREETDASLPITALRETWEEIGLPPEKIQILGTLPCVETVSNYLITPVVATTIWPQKLVLAPAEVEKVFTVPLSWLADSSHWDHRSFTHPETGRTRTTAVYQEFDGEVVWGITAMIAQDLIKLLMKTPC